MAIVQWPGTAGQSRGTPSRRPGSVRRTTTISGTPVEGTSGTMQLVCIGRDLMTGSRGAARVDDEVRLTMRTGPAPRHTILASTSSRCDKELASTVGLPGKRGFRKAVRDVLRGAEADGSALFALLDDVAIATSLSRLALLHNRSMVPTSSARDSSIGICSGWRVDGVMARTLASTGSPLLTDGVPVQPCDETADPAAWHVIPPARPLDFRRSRRLDLIPDEASNLLHVDSMFRDSYVNDQGVRMIVHEYTMSAMIDRASDVILACEAVPRVLPGPQCHLAASSAQHLEGVGLADLGKLLRTELDAESTCTHLTDHLTALAGTRHLLTRLAIGT